MDKLQEIFHRQAEYMHRLTPTYQHNGFHDHLGEWPWQLNSRHAQEEFRLLAWRYTEELFEALDARGREHTLEEFADALHFFIELCICSGVGRRELLTGISTLPWQDAGDSLEEFFLQCDKTVSDHWNRLGLTGHDMDLPIIRMAAIGDSVRAIAQGCMHLKQRPWRIDDRPTPREAWVLGMHLAFKAFITTCTLFNVSAISLHNAYFKKGDSNDQRVKDHGVSL